jgi:hypothetical protein
MSPQVQWLRLSDLPRPGGLAVVAEAPIVVVMPWLDPQLAQATAEVLVARASMPFVLLAVQDDRRAGPCAIWNAAFACTRGTMFGYLASDAFPGRGWLRVGLAALERMPEAKLLAFNDGKWFGQLASFGLTRRAWVQGLYGTNLFHPGYHQHYGDTELTLVARQQQALAYDPHALLVESDPGKDTRQVHAPDRRLFLARRETGFDGRVADPLLLRQFG